ncbi:MAG: hypothetical protein K6A76_08225 [Oribacterium sp.]|nr:hypothetical protein [Oribacterium sp.]
MEWIIGIAILILIIFGQDAMIGFIRFAIFGAIAAAIIAGIGAILAAIGSAIVAIIPGLLIIGGIMLFLSASDKK